MKTVISQSLGLDLVNINVYATVYQFFSTQFKRWGHFHFFRIWCSAKPRPMINVILQFLELDFVNINVYAKVNQNIPLSYLMCYILSISMCMQTFITIFRSIQEIGPFSLFQNLELGKASTDDKCHFAISWARFC